MNAREHHAQAVALAARAEDVITRIGSEQSIRLASAYAQIAAVHATLAQTGLLLEIAVNTAPPQFDDKQPDPTLRDWYATVNP